MRKGEGGFFDALSHPQRNILFARVPVPHPACTSSRKRPQAKIPATAAWILQGKGISRIRGRGQSLWSVDKQQAHHVLVGLDIDDEAVDYRSGAVRLWDEGGRGSEPGG